MKKTRYYGRVLALFIAIAVISIIFVVALDNDESADIRDNGYDYIAEAPYFIDEDNGGYINEYNYDYPQEDYEHNYDEDVQQYSYHYEINESPLSYYEEPPYYSEINDITGFSPYGMMTAEDFDKLITAIDDIWMQYNDCPCPRPCFCHLSDELREILATEPEELSGGLIGIAPLNLYPTVTVTRPHQIQAHINSMSAHGERTILLNFSGNVYTSTNADPVPPIVIQDGKRIILQSVNANNQVWNRDQETSIVVNRQWDRHFRLGDWFYFHEHDHTRVNQISNIGHLTLLNVTLSRSESWVTANPTAISGGVLVAGANILPARRSSLTLDHPNATISNNRSYGAAGSIFPFPGGGIGAGYGANVNILNGHVINNVSQGHGGGIFIDGREDTLPIFRNTVTLENARISGNTAYMGGGGIGMCCNTIIQMHDGATVYNNTALGGEDSFLTSNGGGSTVIWVVAGGE